MSGQLMASMTVGGAGCIVSGQLMPSMTVGGAGCIVSAGGADCVFPGEVMAGQQPVSVVL